MADDLATRLELLTEMGEEADPEIIDAIRAHGTAAIEPLLALACDPELNEAPSDSLKIWAPIHALVLLSHLDISSEVARRLCDLLDEYPDDDWLYETMIEELPRVGEALVEPALAILRDRGRDAHTRNSMADILEGTAKLHPDLRERIATSLVHILSSVSPAEETDDDRTVNAFMLGALGETRQVQWIPFIRELCEQDRVDPFILDEDWVLDTIQGKDPMERYPLPDSDEGLLEELSRFLGFGGRMPPLPPDSTLGLLEPPKPYVAPKRPGRNDPCWCGSGKKYKKCHLREDEENDRQQFRP